MKTYVATPDSRERNWLVVDASGTEALLISLMALDLKPGQTVRIATLPEGLDPDGALRLRLDDGQLERITAGDVFFGGS